MKSIPHLIKLRDLHNIYNTTDKIKQCLFQLNLYIERINADCLIKLVVNYTCQEKGMKLVPDNGRRFEDETSCKPKP